MGSQEEHQKLVDELLFAFGSMPNVRVWPRNVGLAYRDGQAIRYGIVGESDLDGIISPTGRKLSIEVKTGKAVLSRYQERFSEMILKFGGVFILARSVKQALEDFNEQVLGKS